MRSFALKSFDILQATPLMGNMDNTQIGQRIRQIRSWLKISQRELGHLLGVRHNTVCNYETGDVTAPLECIRNLSQISNVSIEWIVNGVDSTLEKVLTEKEKELIELFRQATKEGQDSILEISKILIKKDIEKK